MGILQQLNYTAVALSLVQVVLGLAVLVLAKLALSVLSPYSTDRELTTRDNPAFGLALAGYYAGATIVFLAATAAFPLPLDRGSRGVLAALGADLAWAVGGIVALNASRWLMDRFLVSRFRNDREIRQKNNLAAGALEAAAYVSSAVVLAGALRQPGGNVGTAAIEFLLGLAALLLMGQVYQKLAGYKVAQEIHGANFAAGIALGLTLVALSLLMLKALSGEFTGWTVNLSFFVFDSVVGLLLLLGLRWLTDLALLPKARIAEEIVRDRNVNVGLVEGVLAVSLASIILMIW